MENASILGGPVRILYRPGHAFRESKFVKDILPLGIPLIQIVPDQFQQKFQSTRGIGLLRGRRVWWGYILRNSHGTHIIHNLSR